MTDDDLRDLFATIALLGVVIRCTNVTDHKMLATEAYALADAMLSVRSEHK
jgi:hypothetical protein